MSSSDSQDAEAEAELRQVIEAAPNAMIQVNAAGRMTLVNAQAEALFGYAREELLGEPIELLVPERARQQHGTHRGGYLRDPRSRAMGAGRELHGRRKDGSEVPVEIGLNPILTTRGTFVIASIIDISERQHAERERRELERKIQETQKLESLGVLAGGIAHDFNNLLTGILGNASLARLELPAASPAHATLEQIEQSARRAAELCRQMLAYSGRGRLVIAPLDLNQLILEVTHLLKISIGKSCLLRFNLAERLPLVEGDPSQLGQIIMNLVINASEAIGARSGVIAVSTAVVRVDETYLETVQHYADLAPGDYVTMEVSDNGSGMDAATLARIFEPFFTTKFTGRGLGLAAVLGIVRGHHGGIKVYSQVGSGTTFTLFLPSASGAESARAPGEDSDALGLVGTGRLLVIDDEAAVRAVAARALEAVGYEVELAEDGRQGVELFRAQPQRYRLVLLDLTMPHMDGEETFRQLRHVHPGVRVVLMSGFNREEAMSRFAGKGLIGFVQKPFEIAVLRRAVHAALMAT